MPSTQKARNYWQPCCLAIIAMGFFVTRFWRLTVLPSGLHIDEAGMAYDAWCLANYGVDRFLKSWPVYLRNFGGGQSALYAYLCVICIRIMGFSIWSIRLPGVFASFLNLLFGMKIAKKIFPENSYLPYALGGLIVICPYFILASRFGLDCNLALGFSTMFLYCFMNALEKGKVRDYLLAGVAGGVLLYTYAIMYPIVPLFLLLSFCYLLWTRRLAFRKWMIMAVPFGILAFPLILVQIVNMLDLPEMRLGIFTITKLEIYRASEIERANWPYFLQALISAFCSDTLDYNTVPGSYTLYQMSIALFVLGACSVFGRLILSLRRRCFHALCLPVFWMVVILYFESHIVANANKINAIFFSLVLLIVEGVRVLGSVKGRLRYLLPGIVGVGYLVCFVRFGHYYYEGQYTLETYPLPYFDTMVTEAVQFIEADEEIRQKKTYMAEKAIYYAVSARPSPYKLAITDEMSCYGNYYFSQLGEIEDCNYIVRDVYVDYKAELHQAGFQEIVYTNYSLFYRK